VRSPSLLTRKERKEIADKKKEARVEGFEGSQERRGQVDGKSCARKPIRTPLGRSILVRLVRMKRDRRWEKGVPLKKEVWRRVQEECIRGLGGRIG